MAKNILENIIIQLLDDQPIRLFDYVLSNSNVISSRNGLKKALRDKRVLLDGTPITGAEWAIDQQNIEILEEKATPPKEFKLELKVLFEDEYLAVVYKPAGIPVSGNQFKTIENALQYNLQPSDVIDAMPWPKPCHRLDAPTSGVLLIAKTRKARISLGQQFEDKIIKKKYHAVVMGKIEKDGDIKIPLDDKACHSSYSRISYIPSLRSEYLSIVELSPHTGRTHQLRRHMQSIGHPIVGDKEYGEEGNIIEGKGLFLSSVEISFIHPIYEERQTIKAPQPDKFEKLLLRETKMWDKYNND
ncbi:RluA family pseudouridine synthase [Flammeovirga agarivorans]|uniref:RluA family pseudouridine synthase n=1 Tax=Flammeovirga agarivorans TaxID=2726742 RepID=A0A7X8SHD8_9BACT|nr:RluA family pseudouridine synthase [Flammeovirga agarivorans]NLR90283.1 RluA family pseudouridine synthase [Flammeovirga agarivorans]